MSKPNRREVKRAVLELKKLGMSQEGIADALKVSGISVWNWSNDKSAPNWWTYNEMLAMLYKLKKEQKKRG